MIKKLHDALIADGFKYQYLEFHKTSDYRKFLGTYEMIISCMHFENKSDIIKYVIRPIFTNEHRAVDYKDNHQYGWTELKELI